MLEDPSVMHLPVAGGLDWKIICQGLLFDAYLQKKKDRSSYDSCEYNHPPNVKNQVNFTEVVWSPLGYKGVWSLSIHLQTMSSNASEEASTWRNQLGPILALCSCSLVYWKVILDKSPQQKNS